MATFSTMAKRVIESFAADVEGWTSTLRVDAMVLAH
jgi:hypothetical protein